MAGMFSPKARLSWLDHRFDALIETINLLSPRTARTVVLGMIALFAACDLATGPAFTFTAFYMLAVCLAAWSLGQRAGYAAAIACGVLAALIGIVTIGDRALPVGAMMWNFFARTMTLVFVAAIVGAFHRVFDQTRVRATTDDLTGALTKRAFAERLSRVLAARRETGSVLVFAYCDLDGFKQVNDRHGHAAGDRVLIAFCETASNAIRPRDLLVRVGGDEFVMLMMMEDAGGAYRAAERVHREIRSKMVSLPTPVTVSMGAVIVEHATAEDEGAFLASADSLMYEVKRAGKDALRIAHVDLAEPERLAA